jgi:hypothetical protein
MATAVDPVREKAPIVIPIAVPAKPVPIRRNYHWVRWAIAIGVVVVIAIAWEAWRTHVQNAITYQTVPLERGIVQASVTARFRVISKRSTPTSIPRSPRGNWSL